jgi:hypothetical protein
MGRTGAWFPVVALAVAACLLLAPGTATAAKEKPIFTVADPRGDDNGDGSLIYPVKTNLQRGDLDILSFSAYPDKGGTVFQVQFARPVQRPGREVIDNLGATLQSIARLGFWEFNVDVYVDTDRVAGSGEQETLPGRLAEVAEANAWERAICLTPRPYEAQQRLERLLVYRGKQQLKQEMNRVEQDAEDKLILETRDTVAKNYFFPNLVWVEGTRINFFVPASFLGGTAKPTWGYVVVASFADIEERFDVMPTNTSKFSLMILPVMSGRGATWVGGGVEDDPLQPPLIDIIVPPGKTQEQVLKDYDPRYILTRNHPVQLPAVVPSELPPAK